MKKDKLIEIRKFSRTAKDFADKVDKSFDFSRDGDQQSLGGVWSEEISAFADARTLKALFFSEDWVFIVIDLVAQKLSSVDLNIVKKTVNSDGALISEPVEDHGLVPLIQMPNPWQEYPSWMYNYVVEDALSGNGINWFAKKNGHLIVIPTDQVTLRPNDKGLIDTYFVDMQNDGGFGGSSNPNGIALPAEDIIHTRRPNPASMIWGLSPLTPGRKSILFNRYTADYLNSFYLKQATPSMAIEMERTVNEELALRQLASFESAYTGRRNARRTLLLPKGTSAKPLSHSIADQRIGEMIEKNRENILNLYSVPKHEVGLQTAGSLGSEEHKIALKNFWQSELIPTGKRIQGSLTQFFRRKKMLDIDEFIEFDFEQVEALQDDLMQKALLAKEMAQTMPLNLVMEKVWEEEPINDPRAELPLSLSSTGNAAIAPNPSTSEVREPTRDEPRQPESNEQPDNDGDQDKAFAKSYLSKHGDWLERTCKQFEDEVDNAGSKIESMVLDLYVDFAEKAIGVIRRTLTESKSVKNAKLVTKAEIPDKQTLRRRLEREFDELEEQYVDEYSDILLPTVEVGYDSLLSFVLTEPERDDIEVLRARDSENRNSLLRSRGLDSFAHVSKSNSDRIMDDIAQGVEEGETIPEITRRVARLLGDVQENIKRAERIARTETMTASSIGQNEAFKNADEVTPGYEKIWLNADDIRVRGNPAGLYPNAKDSHWDLQGQRRKKGETFSNGLEYPRDVRSDDPAKVINCRCTMAMVPPDAVIEGLPDARI